MKRTMTLLTGMLLLAMAMTPASAVDVPQEARSAYWEGVANGNWDAAQREEEAQKQLKAELHSIQLWNFAGGSVQETDFLYSSSIIRRVSGVTSAFVSLYLSSSKV